MVDCAFYRDVFHGRLSEEEFVRLSVPARAFLDQITFGRAGLSDEECVRLALCAAVDAIAKNEQGGGIASETVGNWTRDYVAGISNTGTYYSRLRDAVAPYLAGTGLLYAGVSI